MELANDVKLRPPTSFDSTPPTITKQIYKMEYATKQSAGLDLRTNESFTLVYRASVNVGKIEIPAGYVGLVMPKSGLSFKHNIVARLGVIDADYTGDVKVFLDNYGGTYQFEKGDAVAQLVVVPFVQLEGYNVLDIVRGDGGFGHTGK